MKGRNTDEESGGALRSRRPDCERTRAFYSELFGWNIRMDSTGYGVVDTGSEVGIGGGIMQTPLQVPAYVTFYVGVDDLDKYLTRAEELGGSTVLRPMPVGGIGAFAMFADPDGNTIGLFREETDARPSTGS